jgi:transposase InsO family protein
LIQAAVGSFGGSGGFRTKHSSTSTSPTATSQPRTSPPQRSSELVAEGPNRVWSWDITKLNTQDGEHAGVDW